MIDLLSPSRSLQAGTWFKLICGASYQHVPAIRSLAIAYSLAGADCIDVAADPAIIATTQEAIAVAQALHPQARQKGYVPLPRPWLMVSLNDGEDPHFRKAEFPSHQCPSTCHRPCETICPADAIRFTALHSGVVDALCYGCGRCIPICPIAHIQTRSYVYAPEVVVPLVMQAGIEAIEIHTQVGRLTDFTRLWRSIQPYAAQLQLLAISCADGADLIDYLWAIHDLITPLPCRLLWQTDGRPMSGDIGDGTTRACIKLGQKVLKAGLPGSVQLAGGTNRQTVEKLREMNLLASGGIAGIAYGSYARSLLQPLLNSLMEDPTMRLEDQPHLLWQSV
ncbi:MAG: LdpA C-terminal domain-containing domain, partial [Synechococcales bacterium]|nr:LdpA C-terminal domain-containing domain [Synechococcales bacterium]